MQIILGGAYQGKLAYALKLSGCNETEVFHGQSDDLSAMAQFRIIDQLQEVIRRLMEEGKDPTATLVHMIEESAEQILICNEVGCGVVPLDVSDRAFREQVGRTMCVLTKYAWRVDRVIAGIGVQIK